MASARVWRSGVSVGAGVEELASARVRRSGVSVGVGMEERRISTGTEEQLGVRAGMEEKCWRSRGHVWKSGSSVLACACRGAAATVQTEGREKRATKKKGLENGVRVPHGWFPIPLH